MKTEEKSGSLQESVTQEWRDFLQRKQEDADFFKSGIDILNSLNCGICVCSADKNTEEGEEVLFANDTFFAFFDNEMDSRDAQKLLSQALKDSKKGISGELYVVEKDKWFDIHRTEIMWKNRRTAELYTIYDISAAKWYQQRVENQINNDFLTGLYNRMRCELDLESQIKEAKNKGGTGALLYMDLDDFQHINDGLGHQYGDILLKTISRSLQRITGIESACYRTGGDEFIIIVTDNKISMLDKILEDITATFSKPWFLKEAEYYCTMSMGIVRFPSDGDTVAELIKKADLALHEAKSTGKNRYEYYNDTVGSGSYKRLDLEKNMRNAAKDACKEFEVYYQPIVDVSRPGSPCMGAEALIRWNSEKLGFISPAEFIPLAEYLGLINPIGDFVLIEACRECKRWNDMGHPEFKVNVNLSVVQLLRNDMKERVQDALERTGIDPYNLTLEVTESLAINDMARMKKILAEIKELGVRVALDDFGTGYSSLNHIREMPLDVIKIDRCFIENLGKDEFSDAFVKIVCELAKVIDVNVCVEGVENTRQYEILKEMNIQMIQGFYFDRPMKAGEFNKKYVS